MKRFLACLALCASLSASAQDDNCTVLGIQDLTQMVFELQTQLNAQDATIDSLQNAAMTRDSVIAIAIHKELSIDEVTGGDLGAIELPDADISGILNNNGDNLRWADLTNADFYNADLGNVDLTGANLSGAYLGSAQFNFANLTGADLSGANLSGATLFHADLSGANLQYADLSGASLYGASLEEASLNYTSLYGVDLSDADLTGATLLFANLSGANLSGASMSCLDYGCPSELPSGYICEPDTDCPFSSRYRIVPE